MLHISIIRKWWPSKCEWDVMQKVNDVIFPHSSSGHSKTTLATASWTTSVQCSPSTRGSSWSRSRTTTARSTRPSRLRGRGGVSNGVPFNRIMLTISLCDTLQIRPVQWETRGSGPLLPANYEHHHFLHAVRVRFHGSRSCEVSPSFNAKVFFGIATKYQMLENFLLSALK